MYCDKIRDNVWTMKEIKCSDLVRHDLEGAIVCPEADAGHILEPNRKATARDKQK
jgi:hypothetical protein